MHGHREATQGLASEKMKNGPILSFDRKLMNELIFGRSEKWDNININCCMFDHDLKICAWADWEHEAEELICLL